MMNSSRPSSPFLQLIDPGTIAPPNSPAFHLVGNFSGTPIEEVSSPLSHHGPLPELSDSGVLSNNDPIADVTPTDTQTPQGETPAALLQFLKNAYDTHQEAARFILGRDGELTPRETISGTILGAERGTMTRLRERVAAAGLEELSRDPIFYQQDSTARRIDLGEDLHQQPIRIGEDPINDSSPLLSTIEVQWNVQSREHQIKAKQECYLRELKELEEQTHGTRAREEELRTLLLLAHRAFSYQEEMKNRLIASRRNTQKKIHDSNKAKIREYQRNIQTDPSKSQEKLKLQSSLGADPLFLEFFGKINDHPNKIEKRIRQLELAYERKTLLAQRRAEIQTAVENFHQANIPPGNLELAQWQRAEAGIEKSTRANNQLILLLIEDAEKTPFSFQQYLHAKPEKNEVQETQKDATVEKENKVQEARKNAILKNEALAQAQYLLALWMPRQHSTSANLYHGFAIDQLHRLIRETNLPRPSEEKVTEYRFKAAELFAQAALTYDDPDDSHRIKRSHFLEEAARAWSQAANMANDHSLSNYLEYCCRSAELYERAAVQLSQSNNSTSPDHLQRLENIDKAAALFLKAAHEFFSKKREKYISRANELLEETKKFSEK